MNIPYLAVFIFALIALIILTLAIVICFKMNAQKHLKNWFKRNTQTNTDNFGEIESSKSNTIKSHSKSLSYKQTANVQTNPTASSTQTPPNLNNQTKPVHFDYPSDLTNQNTANASNARVLKIHHPMLVPLFRNVNLTTLASSPTSKRNKKSTPFKVSNHVVKVLNPILF